ncbi:pseudaminic acid synthase [Alienimonas californiensis]|uniref:Pseudaminic acid synthase n=1 Tax=Alienimonas californiensis TaxID=2527989 RepID=A0A517P885_9PLAN|nr:pseudaminic acid synthase [Alienimonas californiensis]QDT15555.1 Pseudaminic acid synthase [Alienimonas californiensis]
MSEAVAEPFEIAGRPVGPGEPAYLIAEMSANHGGRYEDAVAIIHAARESGADAIKLQTYTADTLTLDMDAPEFKASGKLWRGRSLHSLYQEAYTPWDWQPKLAEVAAEVGLALFSSPFDPTAIDFLEEMDCPAYKIASFELVDLPLIRRAASTGKPLIMSTGMASLAEIDAAVHAARSAGAAGVALLKCTSAYPASPAEANLRTIPHLAAAFGVPAGLSDHTLGTAVPVAAVALGATVIEKHFTLSRDTPGPDSAFSLEPAEFRQMVDAVRVAEAALGTVRYGVTDDSKASRQMRRSLYVTKHVRRGERFTAENVRSVRPGYGLPPESFGEASLRVAAADVPAGTPLSWELLGERAADAGEPTGAGEQ